MVRIMKYICFIFLISTFFCNNCFAENFDGGTDVYGNIIVSPTLSKRCNISSHNPEITLDCMHRLAYDYRLGNLSYGDFATYEEEKGAIVSEYVTPLLQRFVTLLIASANHEDKIDAMICADPTASGCSNPANDVNTELVYNNNLALENSVMLLDALNAKLSTAYINNLMQILYDVVPILDIDPKKEENFELAGPPNSSASVPTGGE
ncbi:MAG: hypothetical protein E7020_06585 [Alphaproteobacteria bacterium]|nr:hypothetical protein [Alphaproteobacteria bacterium]